MIAAFCFIKLYDLISTSFPSYMMKTAGAEILSRGFHNYMGEMGKQQAVLFRATLARPQTDVQSELYVMAYNVVASPSVAS